MNDSHLPPRYRNPERIARGGMGEIFAPRTPTSRASSRSRCSPTATPTTTRSGSLHARGAGRGAPLQRTEHGDDLRRRRARRPPVHRDGVPARRLARRPPRRDGAQPIGRSLDWLGQAAAALDAAHASGVVHRDVKPANLLLDSDNRVKVADFGVASAVGLGSLTEVGTVVGTAGYLAPEQARGEKATPASDRYALAVVAFELLTGARPFERESSTAEALAHVSAPIPPASSLNPELPSQVDDALARGLAKEPEHRYDSCSRPRPCASRRARRGRRRDDGRRAGAGRAEPGTPLDGCADRARRAADRGRARRSAAERRPQGGGREDHPEDGEGDGHAPRADGRQDRDDRGCAADDGARDDGSPAGGAGRAEQPGLRADARPATTRPRCRCSSRPSSGLRERRHRRGVRELQPGCDASGARPLRRRGRATGTIGGTYRASGRRSTGRATTRRRSAAMETSARRRRALPRIAFRSTPCTRRT